jgi:hypothetical protein
MASFKRTCASCSGIGEVYSEALDRAVPCKECVDGKVLKPIRIAGVQIRVDNRLGHEFVLTVHPDGLVELRQAGHKKRLATSVQRIFNVARMDTAKLDIAAKLAKKKARKKLVKRGLLATSRSSHA